MLLKEGNKAPEFSLPNSDGETVSLSDFKGKRVVLWFFPKANTPGWMIEGKGFRDEFDTFKNNNIEIIGCSADPISKQKKFCDKQNFLFTMLCDESHEMLESYGVWGLKKFMGREYMGISRTTFIIDEKGIIEEVITKVDTKNHTSQILK